MKPSFFQYIVHKDGKLSSNIFYIDASTTVFKLKTLIFFGSNLKYFLNQESVVCI